MVLESSIRGNILQFCGVTEVTVENTLVKKKGSHLITCDAGPSKT